MSNLSNYSRFITRVVPIGDVPLGGHYPIRIQSMTTTPTMDTKATVEQSIRMIEAGCEYVRITAPNKREAENLANIKKELRKKGYPTPLIADIHYTPNAAEIAARIVEKVRINPGNYADKKQFKIIEYSDNTYQQELEKIRERFIPLIKICKEYGTALRIGTNHGSLSDRIMSRYGDTPFGMVESAIEFIGICEEMNYYNIVLSMKASNPLIMVNAYRLLVSRMKETKMNYPLHLGVTEAGEGEDGRIKSAVGIGTLLEDGIGDTIRVSLTEEPEYEMPVAKKLVERYEKRIDKVFSNYSSFINPFKYNKRETRKVFHIGGSNHPVIILSTNTIINNLLLPSNSSDFIYVGSQEIKKTQSTNTCIICDSDIWNENRYNTFPLFTVKKYFNTIRKSQKINFISIYANQLTTDFIEQIKQDKTVVLIFETRHLHGIEKQRKMFVQLIQSKCNVPVIIKRSYLKLSQETMQLYASTDMGALLLDGLGDGIWMDSTICNEKNIINTSYGVLQATRTRITRTEYISCPSCGRTLFDLSQTTAKIREKTSHLKGLKIGIMGCIVNGPGEMADADYGYVGSGIGRITLYKGKEIIKRNVPEKEAVDSLIKLIKEHGDWVDP